MTTGYGRRQGLRGSILDPMKDVRGTLSDLPPLVRSALLGATCAGVVGGVIGLVLGLLSYPLTAPAAVVEVGIPAAVLGALLGLGVGAMAGVVGRRRSSHGRP